MTSRSHTRESNPLARFRFWAGSGFFSAGVMLVLAIIYLGDRAWVTAALWFFLSAANLVHAIYLDRRAHGEQPFWRARRRRRHARLARAIAR